VKKILLSFQQVGGANALLPIIDKWTAKYEVIITGRKLVCDNLRRRGIKVHDYEGLGWRNGNCNKDSTWFEKISPNLVITDTIDLMRASEGEACRDFWELAQKYAILSIAYVDCWWGYDKRFILPGEVTPPVLPNYIAVIDENAKKDILKSNYPEKMIAVLGSPRFEFISRHARKNGKGKRKDLKARALSKSDNFIILFVSQPLEKVFGSSKTYGFTEKTVLTKLLKALSGFPEQLKKKLSLIVLLHPEENGDGLSGMIRGKTEIDVTFRKEESPLDLILAADLVTGMSSILLAEAVIMGCLVISIQPNLKKEEILITNSIGATLSINDDEQLSNTLFEALVNEKYRDTILNRQNRFKIIADAYSRWDSFVENCLGE
jgi:hypothetical protein